MATPGKASLALPRHMVTGSPDEFSADFDLLKLLLLSCVRFFSDQGPTG